MKHLIIKALHRDKSFLSRATEQLAENLKQKGESVFIRDLYELNFNPVLTTHDFIALSDNNLPEDIRKEQGFIQDADYIWFIYPIWWTGMPAILKGYIDRVFLSGFAYEMKENKPVGKLFNKQVVLLNSMGMSYDDYMQSGTFDALALTTDKGIFEFCGMQVHSHKYFSSIMSADEDLCSQYLAELSNLADSIIEKNSFDLGDGKTRRVA